MNLTRGINPVPGISSVDSARPNSSSHEAKQSTMIRTATVSRPIRRHGRLALQATWILLGWGLPSLFAVEPDSPSGARAPWTTSRLQGSPEPASPYQVELAYPRLKFRSPVVLVTAPGTNRLFLAELKGKIVSFLDKPDVDQVDQALDLGTLRPELLMFYGLAFHPKFPENRSVYVCYAQKEGVADGTRVSRFQVLPTNPPTIDPKSETILITWLSGGHNGGTLQFGPKDGYLYISTGDGAGPAPPDTLKVGQDLGSLLSKVLRINVDHHDPGRSYRIPPDNPFVKQPGARGEIWAYGFRNPWKFSFDPSTGDLWLGDVGWELWELIHRVEKAGNYGWSIVEGRQDVHPDWPRGPTPIQPPIVDHPHSEAASMTGGYVYRGPSLPDLTGVYVYGDFQTGTVWGLRYDRQNRKVLEHRELARTPLQLVSFAENHAGELLLIDHERTGQISRLTPNPEAAKARNTEFPRKLSETGLFSSVKEHTPAPGVLPFTINADAWADHARSERLLGIPATGRLSFEPEKVWGVPEGTALAKTISLEMTAGDSSTRKRLETQILHFENESWRPYTYVWNDDQTDAILLESEGKTVLLKVADASAPGGKREQSYRFSGRAECRLCHNPWAGEGLKFGRQSASPLTLNTLQIHDGDESSGRLKTWARLGLFDKALPTDLKRLKRLVNPRVGDADLTAKARSYLHANCAHCHQFGGGGSANILLSALLEPEKMLIFDVPPTQGGFGISGARVIAPADPDGSVLLYRASKLGSGRMPRLGSNLVDEPAIDLLTRWISSMPPTKTVEKSATAARGEVEKLLKALDDPTTGPAVHEAVVRNLLDSTRGASAFARWLERSLDSGDPSFRKHMLAIAAAHPRAETRDLFERYLPDSERARRLGDSIDPKELLALSGDPERGWKVFAESSAQCKTCHKARGVGQALGPDLDDIGLKYRKEELLTHILQPSSRVDPTYVAHLVETTSGQVLTGMLVSKSSSAVVLKDNQNKTMTIPAGEVERLVPQSQSLMPELLLREMTARDVADLLAFLTTLREVKAGSGGSPR